MTQKIYIALCPIAIGKKIVAVDEKLPGDVNKAKIDALLKNGSIKETASAANSSADAADLKEAARVEALIKRATELGIADAITIKTEALEAMVAEAEEKAAADSQAAATLTGAVTKDGRVVELKALKVEQLKALAKDLEIAGADQMKKEALVEAITAIEFEAPTQE